MAKPKKNKPSEHPLKALAKVSGMGLQMGLIIYAGNQLGHYLDTQWQQSFLEASCTLLAIALAIYGMIKQAKKL
ncbi:MAG: AtpZ/AtpI family protein [Flavobacteriia bacterium]|nr:AtpZ/AtpI family protein [Flavobacteriia bacterium]